MNIDEILEQVRREPDIYDNLYDVLGCTSSSTQEQITTEYRQRVLTCHPDRNPPDADTARREFARLTTAYEILKDNDERIRYDRWYGSGLRISFIRWRTMSEQAQSVHWHQAPTQPVLDNRAHEEIVVTSNIPPSSSSTSESDRLLEQFRRYEI
ncbi:DnaJ domain-containing protein [Syncephalis fuscata]|nr:DnaJ domain-containing protein [Syncephalis fuscata]